ncbi:MAG TPA: protoporphyrinogen oxidase, partial [Bacilli bacterium]|nr:protoporphyrinogen oxidase [Bacilli bacterium]
DAQATPTPTQPEYGAKPSVKLPTSVFLTFKDGLYRYISRLVEVLKATDLRTSTKVLAIDKTDAEGEYAVHLETGETLQADAVVVTTQTYEAANLLPDEITEKEMLERVPYISVATVLFAFDRGAFDYDLDASGFLCPRGQGTTITACTWTSSKWPHTATDGDLLLRFYVGRSGEEEIVEESDEEIVRRVKQDFQQIMGISVDPKFYRVTRMREAMPQYTVGHLDRVKAFNDAVAKKLPGVLFTGAGYNGLGIPDCIGHGVKAAEQVMEHLGLGQTHQTVASV